MHSNDFIKQVVDHVQIPGQILQNKTAHTNGGTGHLDKIQISASMQVGDGGVAVDGGDHTEEEQAGRRQDGEHRGEGSPQLKVSNYRPSGSSTRILSPSKEVIHGRSADRLSPDEVFKRLSNEQDSAAEGSGGGGDMDVAEGRVQVIKVIRKARAGERGLAGIGMHFRQTTADSNYRIIGVEEGGGCDQYANEKRLALVGREILTIEVILASDVGGRAAHFGARVLQATRNQAQILVTGPC